MLYCFTHANTGFLKQFGSKSWHHFSSVSRASFRSRFERCVSTHTEAMRVHQIVTCLTLRRTPRHMQERNQVFSIAQNGPRYAFMAPKKDVLTTFSFREVLCILWKHNDTSDPWKDSCHQYVCLENPEWPLSETHWQGTLAVCVVYRMLAPNPFYSCHRG